MIMSPLQTCIDDFNGPAESKALTMTYSKADHVASSTDSVSLCIGSIQYIHVPRFLNDVTQSVALFQGEAILIVSDCP